MSRSEMRLAVARLLWVLSPFLSGLTHFALCCTSVLLVFLFLFLVVASLSRSFELTISISRSLLRLSRLSPST